MSCNINTGILNTRGKKVIKNVWTILGLSLILIVFIIPVVRLVILSFLSDSGLSASHYMEIFKDPITWSCIRNTLYIITASTAISVVIGIFFAWIIAYSDVRNKNLLTALIILPFIIPSYITTLAWTQFMGQRSFAAKVLDLLSAGAKPPDMYSFGGIIFMMGISHYPLVYMLTVSVLRKIPRDLEWSSRVSGGGRLATWVGITLPIALPGITGGGLLAFLSNLDNFSIPAFLGIPAGIKVLSTYIYETIAGFGPSAFGKAAVLSVILGVVALSGTFLQWVLLRKVNRLEAASEDFNPRFTLGKYRVWIETALWVFLLFINIVPLLSMAMSSFIRAYGMDFTLSNLTLEHYRFVLFESQKTKNAIWNSLFLSLTTMAICLIAGTLIAYFRVRRPSITSKSVEMIVSLPYALPGTVLALAMIFAWMEPVPGWNPGVYGTIRIMVLAYMTRFMILQVEGSITAMMQVEPSMEEAARVSGMNSRERWRKILIPLILPGMMSGAFMVMLSSLTELTLSSLLWSSGSETIGLAIFNFEQGGYTTYSTSFSTFVVTAIITSGIIMYWMQKIWKNRVTHS